MLQPLAIPTRRASAFVVVLWAGVVAAAEPSVPDARRQAAAAFDEGNRLAASAQFDAAARAFLHADEISPNATALANAMAAARHAHADLLLVEAALRALDRPDPELAILGREALLDADKRLARLELGCEPLPCTLRVDGAIAASGTRYVLAGDHVVTARGENGVEATQRFSVVLGTLHRVSLSVRAEGAPALGPSSPVAPPQTLPTTPPQPSIRSLPPAVFYVGGVLTIGLAGATTWSGIGALSSKPSTGSAYTQQDKDDFHSNIRRTNYLLAGSAVVGVATAAVGIWFVDWGPREGDRVGLSITPGGASAVLRGAL